MIRRTVDVVVVGGGPAGLAAAARLARAGIDVEVLDRESQLGGIPRHCAHLGFGVRDLHRVLTGPAYARHQVDAAGRAGARLRPGVTVTGWAGERTLTTTSPDGLEQLTARAVVLATGARERPRSARLVPGGRPDGVYTTGQLQQAVHLYSQAAGTRAVIVGAEHVSYSAATTLHHAGVRVVAMVTDQPRHQSYAAFDLGARLRYRFPLLTNTAGLEIVGRDRVEGIRIGTRLLQCDTVVFTGDWIPDHELARHGGIALDPGTRGPAVDTALRVDRPGLFAAGNLLHPVETADVAALDGRFVADSVLRHLADDTPSTPRPAIRVEPPLLWIAPNLVGPRRPPRDRFLLRTQESLSRPTLMVRQAGRLLDRQHVRRTVQANRPVHLGAGWLDRVDPAAGAITIALG